MRCFKRPPLAAILLLVLAGCSTTPVQQGAMTSLQASEPTPQAQAPEVELSAELLYQLLVAEFSGQQGALQLSAATYLKAAYQTRDYRLARRATRIAVYGRDNVTALHAARLWVELEPNNDEAHKSAAALLIAAGGNKQARPHLERLLQGTRQDDDHGYMLVATLLVNDPDPQRALATMKELSAGDADNPHALYAYAYLANKLGRRELAREQLQQLLEREPEHERGLILQAHVLHALGDEQASLESIAKAVRLFPDNHTLRLTYARMLVDARRLKEARREFITLNRAKPGDSDVIYALGLLAMEASDLDEAEAHFRTLLQQQEREEESRFALAQIAEARGDHDAAIEWFSSIAQGERYLEAQLQAARLLAKHRGLEQARHYLRELESSNDTELEILYLAEAELLNDAGQHQEAMAIYDEALELMAGNAELLYARALTAEKIGRLDILERDLKQILQQNPDDSRTLNALGYTLADRTERYQEALDYIERAHRLKPDDAAILDSMGWVLYRLGRLEEARDYLQRALAQLKDAEIAAHLGEVLWVSGMQEEARHVWKAAQEWEPEQPLLLQTIKRFIP